MLRFQYYSEALDRVPKLSVDGTVPNSIHFSHWQGNRTPEGLKADTSTEIALNLVSSQHPEEFTQDIELVTNNHFDTDGLLSVWTVMIGERAEKYRDLLIAAAEAGDFSEYSSRDGVRVSLAIQGADRVDDKTASPFVRLIAGEEINDNARSYDLAMPQVEHLLTHINDYEQLWREGWKRIVDAFDSFDRGASKVVEFGESKVSLVTLAPELFGREGFTPTSHAAPYTAISRYARGELLVIAIPAESGWFYRIDYPYYSWAETIVRPTIQRRELSGVMRSLNMKEANRDGLWELDSRELSSAAKFLDLSQRLTPSKFNPEEVVEAFLMTPVKTLTTPV